MSFTSRSAASLTTGYSWTINSISKYWGLVIHCWGGCISQSPPFPSSDNSIQVFGPTIRSSFRVFPCGTCRGNVGFPMWNSCGLGIARRAFAMADLVSRSTPPSNRARTTSDSVKYHRWRSSEFLTAWAIVASIAWNKEIMGLCPFLYYKNIITRMHLLLLCRVTITNRTIHIHVSWTMVSFGP